MVVRDPEIGDEYLARVVRSIRPGTHARNPLVEILRILVYPSQHAILWPDVPDGHPPLHVGTLCRMPVARDPRGEDMRFGSWEESLAASTAAAMAAADGEELELIKKHAAGKTRRQRSIPIYRRTDIEH